MTLQSVDYICRTPNQTCAQLLVNFAHVWGGPALGGWGSSPSLDVEAPIYNTLHLTNSIYVIKTSIFEQMLIKAFNSINTTCKADRLKHLLCF